MWEEYEDELPPILNPNPALKLLDRGTRVKYTRRREFNGGWDVSQESYRVTHHAVLLTIRHEEIWKKFFGDLDVMVVLRCPVKDHNKHLERIDPVENSAAYRDALRWNQEIAPTWVRPSIQRSLEKAVGWPKEPLMWRVKSQLRADEQ